jgi:HlyD family secretion protein
MKTKKILIATVIAAAAISTGCAMLRRKPDDRIRISGNIELTEVSVSFKVAGKLIERAVDEGDTVKAGQLIARVDREQMVRQHQRDQAGVLSAQSQLVQLRTSIAWQKDTLEHDVAVRRADLTQAEAKLRELENGSRPQEILEARAAVEGAQSQFDRAKKDWERGQELIKNDDISRSQFDQFRDLYDSSGAALKQAKQRLALVVEGPRKEDIEAARAQVAQAKAAVGVAEANGLELKRREEQVAASQAEIERSRAQVGIAQSQLDDTLAYSPINAMVLTKAAEVGEVLAPGTPVVTLGDLDHPWVRGYVGETELGRVKLGSHAKVTTDSFPGKAYDGRVSFIASQAEFTPKQIQTEAERVKLVYRIKIDVQNPNGELKLNMPVDAEVGN